MIIQAYITVLFTIVGLSYNRVVLHTLSFGLFLVFDLKVCKRSKQTTNHFSFFFLSQPHFLILLGGATGGLYGTALHYLNIPL